MKEDRFEGGNSLPDRKEEEQRGTATTLEECCLHGIKLSEFCEKCLIDHRATQAKDEW